MTAQPSHVLTWLPPYLIIGDKDGWWDLQTVADYAAGEPQSDPAQSYVVSRDADPSVLAQWVSVRVGYPVTLRRDDHEIRRPFRRTWHLEPRYYVTPGDTS